jgi:hypothetical protein
MRALEDIQRAHDMLVGIVLGECPVPWSPADTAFMHTAADVLCWVLDHDHNRTFAGNLRHMEELLAEAGVVLAKRGIVEATEADIQAARDFERTAEQHLG